MAAAGGQLGEIRSVLGDFVKELQGQLQASFVSDSGQMQSSVGGATDSHIHGNSVLEGIHGHDIARAFVFSNQLHNSHACMLSEGNAFAVISSGNGAVAGQAHAKNLSQAVHSVSSEQTGAGAAAGASAMLDFAQLASVDLAGFKATCSFENGGYADILAVEATGQHGATAYDYSGNVQASSCHQHTGNNFIAVGNQN